MKKTLIISAIVLGLLAGAFGVSKVKAFQSYFGTFVSSAVATTTRAYLTPGTGTTTYLLANDTYTQNEDVDANYLFILVTASSSTSVFNWQYQYANGVAGTNCYTNQTGCFWFNATTTTTSASATLSSTVSSTTGLVVEVPRIAAKYKRVIFTVPVGVSGGALWLQDTAYRNTSDK